MVVSKKPVVVDSNIIIYTGLKNQDGLRNWLKMRKICVSAISKIEVLGYQKLTFKEQNYFQNFFLQSQTIPIQSEIIELAITFRQKKKMSLGDSIIAATALQHKIPLVTANTKDFEYIENLELINPLKF